MPRIIPVSYKKLVRVLESEGFTMVRERGDHMIFTRPPFPGPSWFLVRMRSLFLSSRMYCGRRLSAANGISSFSIVHRQV